MTVCSNGTLFVTPARSPRRSPASLTGFDGTTTATLASANFGLSGFVTGQGATVSALTGTYNSANVVGATTVTAALVASDFTANAGDA